MKFLHTADWQIGMKAAHVGAVGQRVRDERLAAARPDPEQWVNWRIRKEPS